MTPPGEPESHFSCDAAPVQAEGMLDGHPFYFRARGDCWSFSLAEAPGVDPADLDSAERAVGRGYFLSEPYGATGSFAASYMPLSEARHHISDCIRRYRAARST
jgi:hypothetical protein